MKKHGSTILLIMVLIIGVSLLLYPSFADWWNSLHQSRAVASYVEHVAAIDEDTYSELWDAAREYNNSLSDRQNHFGLAPEQQEEYDAILNVTNNGIIGYVEIPSINVTLPIYHGTDETILQIAVGHLEWSSLPIGGESTHSIISGHRGLPSARLFTDLDKLTVGDIFFYRILDEVLTYEVDQILIVEPHQLDALSIVHGEDLSTLITCTPYGINSHRLLVRGHRIENQEAERTVRVTSDAVQIEPVFVAPFVAAPMLLVLLVAIMIPKKRRG